MNLTFEYFYKATKPRKFEINSPGRIHFRFFVIFKLCMVSLLSFLGQIRQKNWIKFWKPIGQVKIRIRQSDRSMVGEKESSFRISPMTVSLHLFGPSTFGLNWNDASLTKKYVTSNYNEWVGWIWNWDSLR